MSSKAYRKQYYQAHKEEIKEYQKQRYVEQKEQKELKMKQIGGTSGNTGNAINGLQVDRNTSGFFNVTGQPNSSKASANDILRQYRSWIYSCCSLNASSVASQDLRLYATTEGNESTKFLHKTRPVSKQVEYYIRNDSCRKSLARVRRAENIVEIIDHPILDLLENINVYENNFGSFELTSIYLDMIGDSYWYIVKDSMGVPESIWILQSQRMKIVPGKRKFIKGYLYGTENSFNSSVNAQNIKFNTNEIIHFKTPNPNDLYYGLGAAQSVMSAINRMNSMDVTEQARLDNQGRPDLIVGYKGKLDSREMKKIERMWRGALGGASKAGRVKVMDEDFDIKEVGFSPKEMEYLSGRTWSVKEIAAAFGVPYSMLDSGDSKKATSEIAERSYAKNAILPRITRISERLNQDLVPLYDPSGRLFLMYDSPVPQDKKLMLEENMAYVAAGIMTVNEARLRLGMERLEGDEYDTPSAGKKPEQANQVSRSTSEENQLVEGEDNSE